MDEHRVGLKPVIRRIWVDEFTVTTALVNWRFQWLWLYGFVHPQSGQTYWWLLPKVNIELFNRVLLDFANHFDLGKHKQVILVLDRAGWHSSKRVEVPEGIHLSFLPSHSPELQPCRPFMDNKKTKQLLIAMDESLDAMEEALFQRCRQILHRVDFVRGLTNFYWWSELGA